MFLHVRVQVAGACAGCAYWTANFPFDTAKSLIQTEAEYMHMSVSQVMKSVYQRSGLRGLYTVRLADFMLFIVPSAFEIDCSSY